MNVDILMVTHNSARYIEEQLRSILRQENTIFKLFVFDDASTDDTPQILSQYAAKHKSKMVYLASNERLGKTACLNKLLTHVTANFIMFADDNESWLADKIVISYQGIKKLQKSFGIKVPLLVYTDKQVADNRGKVIHKSFVRYTGCMTSQHNINRLLIDDTHLGSTIMVTRSFFDYSKQFPEVAVSYQQWLMLVSAAVGKISYIDAPTCTIKPTVLKEFMDIKVNKKEYNKKKKIQHIAQAKELYIQLYDRLKGRQLKVLESYISLEDSSSLTYKLATTFSKVRVPLTLRRLRAKKKRKFTNEV